MTKRIWASLDDYVMPSGSNNLVGRSMANHYFFHALLKYGEFDEFHFFLSNDAHRRLFIEQHSDFLARHSMSNRVKLFDRLDLPENISNYDYTVFHQSDHIFLYNALCRVRNRLSANFPVTAQIHSISYQEYMGKYLEMFHGGVTSYDTIFCSSHCGKKVLENCFNRIAENFKIPRIDIPLEVVPLGIDEEAITLDKILLRQEYGISTDEVIGLCFGRFSDYDKMDLFPLLNVFGRLVRQGLPWRLVLAGGVNSQDYLEMVKLWARAQKVDNHITIITDPGENEKNALYNMSDFFISVSDNIQETFGLCLLEAMSAGLPLLVSDFNGYQELVPDGTGFRIPTIWHEEKELAVLHPVMDELTSHRLSAQSLCVDVSKMEEMLKKLFEDSNLRSQMGHQARNNFVNRYSHRTIIKQLEVHWTRLKNNFKQTGGGNDPLCMEIFDTFSHYVTRFTSSSDLVYATPYGVQVVSKGNNYPLLAGMSEVIERGLIPKIVNLARKPVSVSDLCQGIDKQSWKNSYLIQWMLKHGLLELV